MPKKYLTAKEAAEKLGVSLPTLYSYVSRGLIRSHTVDANHRARQYFAADVERLISRKAGRKNPEKMVQTALHWGTPVLESALTLIDEHRLYYRGHDVQTLVRSARFEEVASLLWLGEVDTSLFSKQAPVAVPNVPDTLLPIQRLQMALTMVDDIGAYDFEAHAVARTGARILRVMVETLAPSSDSAIIAERLAAQWSPQHSRAAALLNTALILCADHELNASSFTARVIASVNATPYAAVVGGLAALSGAKHGGSTEQAESLLAQIATPDDAPRVVRERLQRGESIPGFGHNLYPQGDPRAVILLEHITETTPDAPVLAIMEALQRVVATATDRAPNIDMALAVLSHALALPHGASLSIFALGRAAGWIAHAMEQYASGQMIRPRAVYTGSVSD
jgi:citrate synthase